MNGPYLTLDEVAEKLGVDYKTVYRLVRNGDLPAGRVGRVYRVDQSDLKAYFEQQKQQVAAGKLIGGAARTSAAPDAWTCPVCDEKYLSALSIGGRCQDTGQPICQGCWHIKRIRSTTATTIDASATRPTHQAASNISSPSTNANPLAHNTTAKAPPDLPEGAVSLEMVDALGASRIRQFGQRMEMLDQITHPISEQVLLFEKAKIKHTINDDFIDQGQPGGPASCFRLKWGGWGKPKSILSLECRILSRREQLVQDGFDQNPMTQRDVLPLLESLAGEAANDEHGFHVLILSSPTGFEPAVIELITGQGNSSAFHDRHLAVVLHNTTTGESILPSDPRLTDLMPLIDPATYDEKLAAGCEPIAKEARLCNNISLADATQMLQGDTKLARDVMRKLGLESDLVLDDLPDVGLVLSCR